MSKSFAGKIEDAAQEVVSFDAGEVAAALDRSPLSHAKPLSFVDRSISGRGVREKLSAVFSGIDEPESTVLLLGALDDIAWLTDGRGYGVYRFWEDPEKGDEPFAVLKERSTAYLAAAG